MKKLITVAVVILAALMLPVQAEAQTFQGNPFTDVTHKYYPLATNRQYVASQGDSAIATPFRIGGCSWASYSLKVSDTATFYINIDWRVVGTTAWNTSHRDTLVWAPADSAATTVDYPLRNNSVDYLGDGRTNVQTRLRIILPASGQSVVGTTNNRYWLSLNWKD